MDNKTTNMMTFNTVPMAKFNLKLMIRYLTMVRAAFTAAKAIS